MRTQSLSKEVSAEASRGLSNSQLLSDPFDEDIFDDESAGHSVAQGMWVGGMVLAEDIVFLLDFFLICLPVYPGFANDVYSQVLFSDSYFKEIFLRYKIR